MDKGFLKKVVEILKQNSYRYSLEGFINDGRYYVREIFIYNCEDADRIKKLFEHDTLKQLKVGKSYSWYLGDRRKAILIKLKAKVELSIAQFESMQTSNYAEDDVLTA